MISQLKDISKLEIILKSIFLFLNIIFVCMSKCKWWIFRWTLEPYLFVFTLAPEALWLGLGRLLHGLSDQFDLTPLFVSVRHPGISTGPLSHQNHRETVRSGMESEFWNSINIDSLNIITCDILICQIIVLIRCNDIFVLKLYPAVVECCPLQSL